MFCTLLLPIVLSFLNQLLSGDQKVHAVLSLLKTDEDRCRLDQKVCLENRKVVLFWDNATCHLETLKGKLANIKLVFLSKNTTWRYNLSMPVSIGILNINTESCLFATSLVDEGNCISNKLTTFTYWKSLLGFKLIGKVYPRSSSSSALKNIGLTLETY